ncbi:hypothetical protein FHU31_002669 [Mycolicibacterium fluoranthenivorans]|uniref:Uncharacterized protein n=1 Tax=Mycolicibacterium fluoranthenivorans TaxID=258505 RepID=A0A7X5ZD50_9MYCO|nr:hypothetical protein [Mycolicibacterium fluoranthenivorans]
MPTFLPRQAPAASTQGESTAAVELPLIRLFGSRLQRRGHPKLSRPGIPAA